MSAISASRAAPSNGIETFGTQSLVEARTGNVLHYEKRAAIGSPIPLQDRYDSRTVERRDPLRLRELAIEVLLGGDRRSVGNLDRDFTFQQRVATEIDCPETANTEEPLDLELSNLVTHFPELAVAEHVIERSGDLDPLFQWIMRPLAVTHQRADLFDNGLAGGVGFAKPLVPALCRLGEGRREERSYLGDPLG